MLLMDMSFITKKWWLNDIPLIIKKIQRSVQLLFWLLSLLLQKFIVPILFNNLILPSLIIICNKSAFVSHNSKKLLYFIKMFKNYHISNRLTFKFKTFRLHLYKHENEHIFGFWKASINRYYWKFNFNC